MTLPPHFPCSQDSRRRGSTGGTKRAVLIAAPEFPDPDRESGSRRTWDAIEFFLDCGWKVTLAVPQCPLEPPRQIQLRGRGVEIVPGLGDVLERRIGGGDFSLVWIAFWTVGEVLIPWTRKHSPGTRIVVDSVDLHFLRRSRERFLVDVGQGRAPLLDPDYGIDLSRELNVYASGDTVLVVSDKEASLVRDLLGNHVPVICWPDGEDLPRFRKPFQERRGSLFVASFRHPPNRDGLKWLCQAVLPRIRRRILQRHPLIVVGHGVDSVMEGWVRETPGVELVGWTPSLRPYWESCRISVVPLRFGAGTKRKLIQSAMVGLPAVSTSIGLEGLALRDGSEVLQADSPQDFADRMSRLLQDPVLWEAMARRGRRAVLRRHSRNRIRERFGEVLAAILRVEPRLGGWIDSSDWIERWFQESYWVLLERVRTAVETVVPPGTVVAVVSKGDERLLRVGERQGWHFPRQQDGVAAGFHPPNDEWASTHLRELLRQGARYLVFPATSLWWFDHYRRFAELLETHGDVLFDQPDTCRIYNLKRWAAIDGLDATAERHGGTDGP